MKTSILCAFLMVGSTMCQNLIQNPSFEDAQGNPTLNGWYVQQDPDTACLSQDGECVYLDTFTFNGGGRWSLSLRSISFPGSTNCGIAYTFITGLEGLMRLTLSFWGYVHAMSCNTGFVGLGILKKPVPDTCNPFSPLVSDFIVENFNSSNGIIWFFPDKLDSIYWHQWMRVSLDDTFYLSQNDTLILLITPLYPYPYIGCPAYGGWVNVDSVFLKAEKITGVKEKTIGYDFNFKGCDLDSYEPYEKVNARIFNVDGKLILDLRNISFQNLLDIERDIKLRKGWEPLIIVIDDKNGVCVMKR